MSALDPCNKCQGKADAVDPVSLKPWCEPCWKKFVSGLRRWEHGVLESTDSYAYSRAGGYTSTDGCRQKPKVGGR